MGVIRIGTSGWDYPEWVGPVYPRRGQLDKLRFYTGLFPIVEVNSSFYRLPPASYSTSWCKRTPSGFRFAVKFPQTITHERRLVGVDEELRKFLEFVRPLQEGHRFAAALLQLPPSLPFEPATVRAFYEQLPSSLPVAVEFREPSWLAPESLQLLRDFRLAYTVVDEPHLPVRLDRTAPFSYLRFHGHGSPVWYDYRYSTEELTRWLPRVRELAEGEGDLYIFFNNHFRGDAAENARQLGELLELPAIPWMTRGKLPT
ncbi:MAG TPA: DUF72 domain-containing protein [Thermoplasmata archaeon]|nr:DUF72 domain-containing protein [Thermoplasmata archaeon]